MGGGEEDWPWLADGFFINQKTKSKAQKGNRLEVGSRGEDPKVLFLDLTSLEGHSKLCPYRVLCLFYVWALGKPLVPGRQVSNMLLYRV